MTDSEGDVSGSKGPGSRGRPGAGAGDGDPASEIGSSGSSTRKGSRVSSPSSDRGGLGGTT